MLGTISLKPVSESVMTAAPLPATLADPAPMIVRNDDGGIAVLTLDRPQARNSLSERMLDALGETLTAIASDRSVRAVVIAAHGPAFCAGHDLKELVAHRADADRGRAYFR